MPPLLLRGWDGRGWFGAQRRRGMQSAGPAKRSGASRTAGSRRAAAHTGSTHYRLAGTNGPAIDGLAGDGRGTASRHARPRALAGCTWPGAGRVCCCCRRATMSGRGGTTGRAAGCPARFGRGCGRNGVPGVGDAMAQRDCRAFAGRRRSAGHRMGWNRDGRGRHRSRGSGWRQGLPRSRQDLAGARRGNGARGNGTRAQRGMQRRSATGGQWRP